jgi:hypothetical protein
MIKIKMRTDEHSNIGWLEIEQSELFNNIFACLESWPGWKSFQPAGVNQDMSAIAHLYQVAGIRDRPLCLGIELGYHLHQVEPLRNGRMSCHRMILFRLIDVFRQNKLS